MPVGAWAEEHGGRYIGACVPTEVVQLDLRLKAMLGAGMGRRAWWAR